MLEEVKIMKKNKGISGENYFKDIGKSTFILEKIPVSIVGILFFFCLWTMTDIILNILIEGDFNIRRYLSGDSVIIDPEIALFILFILFFFWRRGEYRSIKGKPFVSLTKEKIVLNFGKHSFLWDHIQSVDVEGERKLRIIAGKNKKRKKQTTDLKWLLSKEDFINRLKNNCVEKNIPYHEPNLTLSSRISLFFNSVIE